MGERVGVDASEARLGALAAGATAATLVLAAITALRVADGDDPSGVVLAIAAAFVPYAGLAIWRVDRAPRRAQAIALALAALAGLALVGAPPLLSDDVYRYLWDARVLRHGIDPYAYAPSDPALASLRDALHARVNHPDLPTIYPPLAQLAFALADALAHAAWSAKLLALGAHLATTPVVARLAGPHAARAAALHALNPLALEEAALGGHVDALAALLVALAALAMVRGARVRAALALGAAAATKLVGLALVPLLAARRAHEGRARSSADRALPVLLAIALGLGAIAPLASAGHARGEASGLGHYARRWRGNEGAFALISEASRWTLEGAGRLSGAPPGWIRLPFLAPVLERVRGTPLDPRATFVEPKKAIQRPTSFETRHLGDLLARAIALVIVVAIALRHARRGTEPLRASRDVLFALLLVAPQVHPWYLAWLLPLEIAAGGAAGLAWSAAILIAYAPLAGWARERVWHDPALARAVEYAIVGLALVAERRRPRGDLRREGRRTEDTGAIPHGPPCSEQVDP